MGEPDARVEVLGPLRLVVDGPPVEVPRAQAPGRARAARARRGPGRHRRPPRGRAVARRAAGRPAGRPCTRHVSRLRAGTRPGGRPAADPAGRLPPRPRPRRSTPARRACSPPRATAGRRCPCCSGRTALWRGPVLADLTDVTPIATAVEGCARLHREVTDALVAAAVDAGRADDVVGLAADGARRRPAARAGRAARSCARWRPPGRPPDALRVGREFRRRLADETGLDPAPRWARSNARSRAGRPVPPHRARGPTARLFGREADVGAVHRLLAERAAGHARRAGRRREDPGGLEVAGRSDGRVLLLAPVTDPAALPHALAAALGLRWCGATSSRPASRSWANGRACWSSTTASTCSTRPGTAVERAARPPARELSVLATSREPLGLAVEYRYRLPPLALPAGRAGPGRSRRSRCSWTGPRRVRPGFTADAGELALVADIVRRLDGMPLAIELAAGRLSGFSLAELAARLDRALDLLGGGGPAPTPGTGRCAPPSSGPTTLLDRDEQRLFRYLAVFVDGVDLDTAERARRRPRPGRRPGRRAGPARRRLDGRRRVFEGRGTRYRMLETLRAFGLDRLVAAGEDDDGRAPDAALGGRP